MKHLDGKQGGRENLVDGTDSALYQPFRGDHPDGQWNLFLEILFRSVNVALEKGLDVEQCPPSPWTWRDNPAALICGQH